MESHKTHDDNRIVVRRSTIKTVLGLVVSLLLVALSAFAALIVASPASASFADLTTTDSLFIVVVATAGAIAFTALLIFYASQLFSPNPLLVIDSQGITDHASWLSVGTIRWEEIAAIIATNRSIVIVPRNIEPILARQRSIKRVFLSINIQFTAQSIIIPGLLMSMSTSTILTRATTAYSNNILEHNIRIHVTR